MNRSRGRLTTNLLFAVVASGTTWLAMSAWRDLTAAPGGFLNPLLLLAVVVAGTGTAARTSPARWCRTCLLYTSPSPRD